jgi:hypothetical protein
MSYKDKIHKNIREYCKAHFQLLNPNDFELGENLFNRRCHLNAVQKIKEGKANEVYLCIAWDKDDKEPCIHFINKLNNGKWQDNTWGWLYERSEYYLIRKIDTKEYDCIWNILNDSKINYVNLNSNSFLRWLYRIKIKEII